MPRVIITREPTVSTAEPRLLAPLVYRDCDDCERWLVRPPATPGTTPTPIEFKGPDALHLALEYAHQTFGCARRVSR